MRRRSKILLLGACGLITIAAVCFFSFRDNEPSYNGRRLSEWLVQYDPYMHFPPQIVVDLSGYPEAAKKQAADAVRHIGTNAVPTLTKWRQTKDSVLNDGMAGVAAKFRGKAWSLQYFVWNHSAGKKNRLADLGFEILGTNAVQTGNAN